MGKTISKTMLTRIQESKKATNIYVTDTVARHLAQRLISQAKKGKLLRMVILNKDDKPDIQVFVYKTKKK